MDQPNKKLTPENPLAGLESWLRTLIREEIQAAQGQNGNHKEGQLLSPEHAAERLDMPVSKVRELARKGELRCTRIGHYVRFAPADLARFIEDYKEQPPSK